MMGNAAASPEDGTWEAVALGDICSQRREQVHPDGSALSVYVGLEHIESGRPVLRSHGDPSSVRSAKSRFYPGDVLYGKLRPYLDKAALASVDGMCSTDIIVLTAQDRRSIPDYLVNLMHTGAVIEHAKRTTHGVNHPRTSWSALSKFRFVLPPLPEQRAMAAVLSKIQDAIAAQERIIERTRELKKALTAKLFAEASDSHAKTTIGDIAEVKGGKRLPKGEAFAEGVSPYPYVRVVDFYDNTVRTSELKYLTQEIRDRISRYVILTRDVYISIAGTIGVVGVVPPELDGANLTENAARIAPRDDCPLMRDYLMLFLDSELGQRQIASRTTKTSQPKLALARIKTIEVPVPSRAEQEEVVASLTVVSEKVRSSERKKATLRLLFKAMLHELMTGRIRTTALIEAGA